MRSYLSSCGLALFDQYPILFLAADFCLDPNIWRARFPCPVRCHHFR